MSIDTWAVDYVLLDEQDRILGDTHGYRDGQRGAYGSQTADAGIISRH